MLGGGAGTEPQGLGQAPSTDPADPRVQELARKWFGLVEEFTGGDPGTFNSVKRMYQT